MSAWTRSQSQASTAGLFGPEGGEFGFEPGLSGSEPVVIGSGEPPPLIGGHSPAR